MGGYLRMLSGWRPAPIDVPTLLIRAEDEAAGQAAWPLPHTVVTVPGDHFTLIEEHAPGTAEAAAAAGGQRPDRHRVIRTMRILAEAAS